MKNREVIHSVRVQTKIENPDSLISDRAILSLLRQTALKYIRQAQNVRKLLGDSSLYTPIPCLQMEEVPLAECCSYVSPCTISRSKYKLPQIASNIFGSSIEGVWNIDRTIKFIPTTPNSYADLKKLKLRNKNIYYWLFNEYLYVSSPDITLVSMSALFEDEVPEELLSCGDTDEDDCPINPYDNDFKCPSHMIDDVVNNVVVKVQNYFKRSIEDVGQLGIDETR